MVVLEAVMPNEPRPDPRDPAERPPPGIDVSRAHAARMYDFYLGGKDNFADDRATAAKAHLAVRPAHNAPDSSQGRARSCGPTCP